jgi:hypothetical protein
MVLNMDTAKNYSKEHGNIDINEKFVDLPEFKLHVYKDLMAVAA